ncbi:MAG: hypothetical protein EOO13_01665 [Chitinophagaceae bacterium]|nr:MAG: hypothetical protein EOO13_01665 [Chitinophagaceae bacterium]
MRKLPSIVCLLIITMSSQAQKKGKLLHGMYVQWGYNTEWYTKSNIHFKLANGDDFRFHKAVAHDKPDMDAIWKSPGEISIPQYNYRLGFYINKDRTKSLELNFDHIKYVVTRGQKVKVTGVIDSKPVNGDSVLNSVNFLHLEHTDGGNLLHLNYVQQNTLIRTKGTKRPLVNLLWKAGAGINIPRTDFTYHGDRFNNKFHIAGYNLSAEAGARIYPLKHFFLEGTAKSGFVRYVNALADTKALKGSRVSHGFGYLELIASFGFDIRF